MTMLDLKPRAQVRKRDGRFVPFDSGLIYCAIEKAFKAENELAQDQELTSEIRQELTSIVDDVVSQVFQKAESVNGVAVEEIQDVVEMHLMRSGHYKIAKCYILYREKHRTVRTLKGEQGLTEESRARILVTKRDGSYSPLVWNNLRKEAEDATRGLTECSSERILEEGSRAIYNTISQDEIDKVLILAARSYIEKEPDYAVASARLLLNVIYKEVFNLDAVIAVAPELYRSWFRQYLELGVQQERLNPSLLEFDIDAISEAIQAGRDNLFLYMGLQTIYDRYLIHIDGRRIETPQYFWMRVAMGLALNEEKKEECAIEFYNMLSTFRFVSSTPTLFNAATLHPQLSSCYLSTINDDLAHIYKVIADNAQLSKWAGGIGNDWTSVRATGAMIKGTNGQSQGVIPFLKVANDTAIAVNQGGKRKGAVCAYLESWHLEIEEFLELRKNTGDERRRTHDMNTANWIPDLFMKRVAQDAQWTLFSPSDTEDLHDLYGKAFEKRYEHYEALANAGQIKLFKRVRAVDLWRKGLSMLFETGHPWMTFKDPSNIRSPQDHQGVVHSSNLCTEILLNTSEDETAVCNLGSVNLAVHCSDKGLDKDMIKETVSTAVRMLDNVIDLNYYPTKEAANSNQRHRPVGLGIMGFQDSLYKQKISYASEDAVEFADSSMEAISYFAILASSNLAKERGKYPSYEGSKWSKGLLPIDTLDLLESEREGYLTVDRSTRLDWDIVREALKEHGMRNSNVMAIAPTATIANISGVYQSIEPAYSHLFVKSNLSGEFITVNPYLVEDLKKLNLWDAEMIDDLKYFDGMVSDIERVPDNLKQIYLTAFEIDPEWLIECGSRRQKWIDMGQSLNLYLASPDGKKLSSMYMSAWKKGLKTTYYLRSRAATQVEKSSMDINRRGIQPRWMKNKSASSTVHVEREIVSVSNAEVEPQNPATVCDITREPSGGCEACE